MSKIETSIAAYISRDEYRCPHCRRLPPDLVKDEFGNYPVEYQILFNAFKNIREQWGKPIPISSGYRCPSHELEISGSNLGPHVFGLALDLAVNFDEIDPLVTLILEHEPNLRVGVNRHPGSIHVHIDCAYLVRPRWAVSLIRGARWEE